MEATRILWSRDDNGSAVINRIYGTEKHVVIPSYVDGVQGKAVLFKFCVFL